MIRQRQGQCSGSRGASDSLTRMQEEAPDGCVGEGRNEPPFDGTKVPCVSKTSLDFAEGPRSFKAKAEATRQYARAVADFSLQAACQPVAEGGTGGASVVALSTSYNSTDSLNIPASAAVCVDRFQVLERNLLSVHRRASHGRAGILCGASSIWVVFSSELREDGASRVGQRLSGDVWRRKCAGRDIQSRWTV